MGDLSAERETLRPLQVIAGVPEELNRTLVAFQLERGPS